MACLFEKRMSAKYLWILLVIVFFCLRLPDFLINAFVPDEIMHVLHMQDLKHARYLAIDNFMGHGSAFWYMGALCERFFGDVPTFFILRIFSLLALTATAFLVIYSFVKSFHETKYAQTHLFFTVFILTLPLFWWGGKLIFPEFFQCFLIALAYYFIYLKKKNFMLAFFMLGFCAGLKLPAAPAVLFFMADYFFATLRVRQFKYFIGAVLCLVLGFIVCNPIMLTHVGTFIENIRSNGAYLHPPLWEHWLVILTGRYSEWDLAYFGGINSLSIPLINLFFMAILIVFACAQKTLRATPVLIFICTAIAALTVNQRFLSHYVFTMVILVLLLATRASHFKAAHLNVLLCVGILVNMFITVPDVLENRALSSQLQYNMEHAKEHTECIVRAVQHQKNIGVIIDNSDMGSNVEREHFFMKDIFLEESHWPHDIPIVNSSGSELDLQIKSELLSSFMQGHSQILYLEGKRTRNVPVIKDRYSLLIPRLSFLVSQMTQGQGQLNSLYLDTCVGTNVSVLSVKKEGN